MGRRFARNDDEIHARINLSMKNVFNFFILFLFVQVGFSQTVDEKQTISSEDNKIYNSAGIDVKPEYPGGITEFYKYIANNYQVPNIKNFKGGKVVVIFVIEKDGSLTDIKVLKDAGYNTGEEAIRILKLCENWKPAELNGYKVRVSFVIPITLNSN